MCIGLFHIKAVSFALFAQLVGVRSVKCPGAKNTAHFLLIPFTWLLFYSFFVIFTLTLNRSNQSQRHFADKTPYLLISPLPETSQQEDDSDGWLQVGADGLDVDEELTTLTGLDNWDPQHRHHHQHKDKYPAACTQVKCLKCSLIRC